MQDFLEEKLQSITPSFEEIPIVDFAPFLGGSDAQKVAREIGHICENVGFLYIKNHGVPQTFIDDMYAMTRAFFDLSAEEKMALDIKNSGPALRGYIPSSAENVNPGVTRDMKECYDLAWPTEAVSPFFGPNPYPSGLPRFREVYEAYHEAMINLARKLISAIAVSLDLPSDYFEQFQKHPITIQRMLRYPAQSGNITEKEIGIGAHTDYGFLTILSQDEQGGLQVRNCNGEWVSAPHVDGTFIINIGDLVQTLTNDRYISTEHRVVNSSGRIRHSLAFFIDMDFDAVVSVVPTCEDAQNPAKYSPYTCGSHKYRRYVASFGHLRDSTKETARANPY